MKQIVECVPNFSDGRRPHVYNAIADAIRAVPGTHVLDVSSDPDHNRTVVTFVGSPSAVEEGAFKAIAEAARHINLDEHEGEHPRLGATDVCPFVPVKGVTIDECIAIASRLGERVGNELGIPVYLYGDAARTPEREKLSDIRRGQYEKWREEVGKNPERRPDFGPAEPKPWGATTIGVRPFLIAYNIYLNSDDVDVANKIARSVRFSTGGLRHVQALGFMVEGQAQVSMNLTDFSKTSIFRVQEMVRREAARYGMLITKAELVGLTPEKALLDAARWYLQLDDLQDAQVLELQLAEEEDSDFAPAAFLAATAAGTPTPGGGSAAALAGAIGAALTEMVANLTVGRKKYADVGEDAQTILNQAESLRGQLTGAVVEDAVAFEELMDAWKNKELDEQARAEAIERATIQAGEVPLNVARLSRDVVALAARIAEIGNVNAVTDAAAGAIIARAAVQAAALNVKVNASGVKDDVLVKNWFQEMASIESEVNEATEAVVNAAAVRGGF
jgi:glutamate formiminotransferase/formiminotetrahydrofolate cyclodeaminase